MFLSSTSSDFEDMSSQFEYSLHWCFFLTSNHPYFARTVLHPSILPARNGCPQHLDNIVNQEVLATLELGPTKAAAVAAHRPHGMPSRVRLCVQFCLFRIGVVFLFRGFCMR